LSLLQKYKFAHYVGDLFKHFQIMTGFASVRGGVELAIVCGVVAH
jgi:hypothetical protein